MPKISIITPVYNAADYLPLTYDSVKAQTHTNWEWICVDDCSTDNSIEVLKTLQSKDDRIKIFQNEKNSGAAITRNRALDESDGDYVAFLDSDDLWTPVKLEEQIKFMSEHQSRFSYHDYDLIDQDGTTLKTQTTPTLMNARRILKYNPFGTSSIMLHASITDHIRFREHLLKRQDYLYWYEALIMAHQGKKLGFTLSSYRIDSNSSLSADKKAMAKIQWQILRDEFKLSMPARVYYFICYAFHGVKKYFL